MDQSIQNLPLGSDEHVFAYLNDVCIVTETFEDHFHYLELVLQGLVNANLQINLDKSEVCCLQVRYLG